ncbi:hypothetical protein EI94DRAFT_1801658 [Lactarius quietus]|nr:hypothetical protein EI94DRAFT_1801658 [Lactarius quietus]
MFVSFKFLATFVLVASSVTPALSLPRGVGGGGHAVHPAHHPAVTHVPPKP